jgi:hypothetical protein
MPARSTGIPSPGRPPGRRRRRGRGAGARSNSEVDDEMRDRVARMPSTPGNAEPALPDWLVQALVRVVGTPRTEVDRLSEPDAQRISRNGSQND